MNYSKALELLKEGKKVSCKRWGTEGKVYLYLSKGFAGTEMFKILLLHDTTRGTRVVFTPSVENQIQDEWYEIENENEDN